MAKRQSILAAAAAKAKASEVVEASNVREGNSASVILSSRETALSDIADGRRRNALQRLVEPEKCRMWRRHNRLYERLNEANCSDLIEQIGEKGQKIPAIARKLKDDTDGYEYEVICGARRHFAVSYLRNEKGREDVFYLIEVRSLSDEEAFQLSDVENRTRKDISDYERGLDYASALKEFYDDSVSEMASRIGIARQSLSNYLYLARLPKEVVDSYPDPTTIAVRHATVLIPLLNDPKKGPLVRTRACELSKEQARSKELGGAIAYDGSNVFRQLKIAAEEGARMKRRSVEKISIPASTGGELFAMEKSPRFVTIRIPKSNLNKKKELLDGIRKNLA